MNHFLEIDPGERRFSTSGVVILPVPYEGTVSYGKGTKSGPSAILKASKIVEDYDVELGFEPYKRVGGIHTADPVKFSKDPHKQVYSAVKRIISAEKFPLMLGGEHSITYGAVKASKEAYPDLSVLQFDAHADLRDSYHGNKHSHACIMRRIRPMCPAVQVGIRSQDREEADYIKEYGLRKSIFYAHEYDDSKIPSILKGLTDDVYITVDVDGFDPSVIPATGTPEPGGLYWYQVLSILKEVFARKNVVGADVVELAPKKDLHYADYTIAKLVYKMIGYLSLKGQ